MTETNTSVIENLKLMMEASAWDGKLELSDALANIEQLRAALTEALAFNPDWADFNNGRECGRIEATEALAAQPVREPLSQGAILAVFSDAETAMRRNPNLSWRYAIIDEVERAHGIGVDK